MYNKPPAFLIKYNGLVVIQSLPADEQQTGKHLFLDTISRRCELNGHGSYFYDPQSKQDMIDCLQTICSEALQNELMPIIHFEMHGSQFGLELSSGEIILWNEISDYCLTINIITKNQLIVTLASCWGSCIWQMIDLFKPAPYWGFIGPKETINSGDLMEDFTDFYDTLLTEKSLDDALGRLRKNERRSKYVYLHAKGIFENYIEKNPELRLAMDKEQTFKRLFGKSKDEYPLLNRSARRKKLKSNIAVWDRGAFIAKTKRNFLMQ